MAYGAIAYFSCLKGNTLHIGKGLDTVNSLLYHRRIILYPIAHTGKTQGVEPFQVLTGGIVGVSLKAELEPLGSVCPFKDLIYKVLQVVRGKESRRTTP